MFIMTTIGPTPHQTLFEALKQDLQMEDPGIDLILLTTDWGCTIKLARQGRPLTWRVTLNQQGQCGIYKPPTASLPAVAINLPADSHLALRDYLVEFIQRGWV